MCALPSAGRTAGATGRGARPPAWGARPRPERPRDPRPPGRTLLARGPRRCPVRTGCASAGGRVAVPRRVSIPRPRRPGECRPWASPRCRRPREAPAAVLGPACKWAHPARCFLKKRGGGWKNRTCRDLRLPPRGPLHPGPALPCLAAALEANGSGSRDTQPDKGIRRVSLREGPAVSARLASNAFPLPPADGTGASRSPERTGLPAEGFRAGGSLCGCR